LDLVKGTYVVEPTDWTIKHHFNNSRECRHEINYVIRSFHTGQVTLFLQLS